mmetsp:Transcript_17426/g.58865  ORF Transcript_17426/g.58865 Transcript_17426/m.58865 type:complete len:212 (+) Transcript_17426:357-992(+)
MATKSRGALTPVLAQAHARFASSCGLKETMSGVARTAMALNKGGLSWHAEAKAQATFAKTCGCNSASFAFKSWCEIASKSFASKRRADAKAQERLASSRSLKRAPCPKSFNAWDPSASKTPSKSAAPSSRRAPAANAQANRETSSAAKLSASSKTRLETTWYNWPSGICFCKRCCAECFAIAQTIRDKCGAENESIAASTRAAADAKTFGE